MEEACNASPEQSSRPLNMNCTSYKPFHLKQQSQRKLKLKKRNDDFRQKIVVSCGGEKGIRTLGRVLAYTRFPVVRLRPAQPSLHAFSVASVLYNILLKNAMTFYKNITENMHKGSYAFSSYIMHFFID